MVILFDIKKMFQRYQVQRKYFNKTTHGNVILIIGGEDELDDSNICLETYNHMKIAKENNALIVQVGYKASFI
jgi:hypothetical protein